MDKPKHEWGRMPEYMSPTSMNKFWSDREEYYLNYLALDRPPKFVQTKPMSVGSAFDAYAKSHLHKMLFDNWGVGDEFRFQKIFESQVDAHNRDWALIAGKECWDAYLISGSLGDLAAILKKSETDPRFEFTVKGTIGIEGTERGVPLLGKPDIHLTLKDEDGVIIQMIDDWKVNGYCAKMAVSPVPGYVKVRDGWKMDRMDHTPSHGKHHKDAVVLSIAGCMCNVAKPMELVNKDWATQVSTYAWLLGVPVGAKFIAAIDQLACGPADDGDRKIRIAQHRNIVGKDFQHEALQRYVEAWEVVNSDHIFRDISREDSLAKCEMLDKRAATLRGDGSERDNMFSEMTRGR